jgi:exoribonuclease II
VFDGEINLVVVYFKFEKASTFPESHSCVTTHFYAFVTKSKRKNTQPLTAITKGSNFKFLYLQTRYGYITFSDIKNATMEGFLSVEIYRVISLSDTVCDILPLFQQGCRVIAEWATMIR